MRRTEERYFMGVDLGQANDSTAVAVVRRVRYLAADEVAPSRRQQDWREEQPSLFQCGYLERVPLGTTYPGIVAHVSRLLAHRTWAGNISLAIDKTGVGAPVADLFSSAGVSFAGVTITGGDTENNDGNDWRVPKITLISGLQAKLHEGRLRIQKDLPEAATLVRELQEFRVRFTEAGHMAFGAREGKHDDLVLALAIAVWRATKEIRAARWSTIDFMQR